MKRLSKIQRALKAPKDQKGYGFVYRKASDILQAVKPLLEEDNLTILLNDTIQEIGGKYFLHAEAGLFDENGQQIAGAGGFAMMDAHKGMSAEQATGSASSYARKYALCGLLAIDDSTDDPDGLPHDTEPTKSGNNAPQKKAPVDATKLAAIQEAVAEVNAAKDEAELRAIWSKYQQFQTTPDFVCAKDNKKKELNK
jgi:hypothetical protein